MVHYFITYTTNVLFHLGRVLVHDSYTCGTFAINETRGFPTQRLEEPFNFVGAVAGENGNVMLEPCPPPCRSHQDWIYC